MFVTNGNIHGAINVMRRYIHLCPVMYSVNKQAKMMAKLLTGSHRKKKNWQSAKFMAESAILPSNKQFQQGSQTKRRVDVLNKLFMRSITDLLATGDVATDLIGRGISITKVKVTADFSGVNVYWIAKETVHDAELDKILENAGFELRHHLCQLHVMGKVPSVCFVEDKWQTILENTLQCLEKAQLEDGYMPEDLAENMKSDCVLDIPINPEILAKINDLENWDDPFPSMTHNILGLDHAAIMSKIARSVEKSEARHRQNASSDYSISHIEPSVNDSSGKHHNISPSDITRYITQQRIQKKKAQRALQKELLQEAEFIEKPQGEEYIDMVDGDFIEEFEDSEKSKFRVE